MKKTKLLILGMALLLAMTMIFVSCDEADSVQDSPAKEGTTDQGDSNAGDGNTTTGHVHSYGEWNTIETATCVQSGMRERSCACGEKETEVIYSTGHEWIDATCTTPTKCKKCDETQGTANGHSFGSDNVSCEDCDYSREIKINLPQTDLYLEHLNYKNETKTRVKVTNIEYEVTYWFDDDDISVSVLWAGEKTYDEDGSNVSGSCYIGYKLYDSEGYVVDSGMSWSTDVKVGEKFKNAEIYLSELDCNETYTLELLNYS